METIIELAVKLELSQAFLNKVASHPEATVKKVVEITKGCLYYIIDAPKDLHHQITDYGFMTHIKNPVFQKYYNGEAEFIKIAEAYVADRQIRELEAKLKKCNQNLQNAHHNFVTCQQALIKHETDLNFNSTQLIGRVKDRHKELEENYGHEYKSFYTGWLEGRVDLLGILRQTEDK